MADIRAELPGGERRRPEYEIEACLIVVQGHKPGHIHLLTANSLRLGRDYTADIMLGDPAVSRRQASLERVDDAVYLVDGGSTNGTYVNDQKIANGQRVLLHRNDLIRMGNTELKFLPAGDREAFYIRAIALRTQLDTLTGIFNKGYLLESLDTHFARARARSGELSLMVVDLDKFKLVNDTFGHDVGDQILKFTARTLAEELEPHGAVLGRFGGEEFVVILPSQSLTEAVELAEILRRALGIQPATTESGPIRITASIGVAAVTDFTQSAAELFRQADQALYRAKNSGRNCVVSA